MGLSGYPAWLGRASMELVSDGPTLVARIEAKTREAPMSRLAGFFILLIR